MGEFQLNCLSLVASKYRYGGRGSTKVQAPEFAQAFAFAGHCPRWTTLGLEKSLGEHE